MKYTITLADFFLSELKKTGFNFYSTQNEITFYNEENQIHRKIILYDNDIKKIAQRTIFLGIEFLSAEVKENFEKAFLSRFYNREINQQTIESFSILLFSKILEKKDIITSLFDSTKFLENKSISNSKSDDNNVSRNNLLNADLPQDKTDISLDVDSLEYANDTSLSKSTSKGGSQSSSDSSSFNFDNVEKLSIQIEELFNSFEKSLFMYVI